jgi:hypothetical protein
LDPQQIRSALRFKCNCLKYEVVRWCVPGKVLGDDATEVAQDNKVGEFEAVTEGSAGGENRIPQAQRTNFYAEVNGASGAHFVQKDITKPMPFAQDLAVT